MTNWTLTDRVVRTSVTVGVAYGSDVGLVTRLMEKAADEHASILKEPARTVLFEDFGGSALIFELMVWVKPGGERGLRTIRSDLRYTIDAYFRQHNVIISFPQRGIHVDGSIALLGKNVMNQ